MFNSETEAKKAKHSSMSILALLPLSLADLKLRGMIDIVVWFTNSNISPQNDPNLSSGMPLFLYRIDWIDKEVFFNQSALEG